MRNLCSLLYYLFILPNLEMMCVCGRGEGEGFNII